MGGATQRMLIQMRVFTREQEKARLLAEGAGLIKFLVDPRGTDRCVSQSNRPIRATAICAAKPLSLSLRKLVRFAMLHPGGLNAQCLFAGFNYFEVSDMPDSLRGRALPMPHCGESQFCVWHLQQSIRSCTRSSSGFRFASDSRCCLARF